MITKHSLSSAPAYKYRYGGMAQTCRRTQYRHGGNGIFSNLIGREHLGDSIKNLINSVSKVRSNHKVSSALVEGAAKALQPKGVVAQVTTSAVNNIVKRIINRKHSSKKKKKEKEHEQEEEYNQQIIPTSSYIEQVINSGKGIVYD